MNRAGRRLRGARAPRGPVRRSKLEPARRSGASCPETPRPSASAEGRAGPEEAESVGGSQPRPGRPTSGTPPRSRRGRTPAPVGRLRLPPRPAAWGSARDGEGRSLRRSDLGAPLKAPSCSLGSPSGSRWPPRGPRGPPGSVCALPPPGSTPAPSLVRGAPSAASRACPAPGAPQTWSSLPFGIKKPWMTTPRPAPRSGAPACPAGPGAAPALWPGDGSPGVPPALASLP